MFNSKKETTSKTSNAKETTSSGINSLGPATKIVGDLTADHDIRIDGLLNGNIHCGGKLILGSKGKIVGEIDCENAVIEGTIEGIIRVKDSLQVKETGRIVGDLECKQMLFHYGASFTGKCEMGGQTITAPKSLHTAKSA